MLNYSELYFLTDLMKSNQTEAIKIAVLLCNRSYLKFDCCYEKQSAN